MGKCTAMGAKAVLLVVLALVTGTAAVSSASAAPVWKFNGNELKGSETVKGKAAAGTLAIPGAPVECGSFVLGGEVANGAGGGTAKATELSAAECTTTNAECTVSAVEARALPWLGHLSTVEGNDYLVLEKVQIAVTYAGELCPLTGRALVDKGSAAGLVGNAAHTIAFTAAASAATVTGLRVGATAAEWQATFAMEALGAHKGEGLEG